MKLVNIQTQMPFPKSFVVALEKQLMDKKKSYASNFWGTRHFFEKHGALGSKVKGYFVTQEIQAFPFLSLLEKERTAIVTCNQPDNRQGPYGIGFSLFHESKWKTLHYASQRDILEKAMKSDVEKLHCQGEKESYKKLFVSSQEVYDRKFERPSAQPIVVPLYSSSEWFNIEQTSYKIPTYTRLSREIIDKRMERVHTRLSCSRVTVSALQTGDVPITAFERSFESFFNAEEKKAPAAELKPVYMLNKKHSDKKDSSANRDKSQRCSSDSSAFARDGAGSSMLEEFSPSNESLWEYEDCFDFSKGFRPRIYVGKAQESAIDALADRKKAKLAEQSENATRLSDEDDVQLEDDFGFG